MPRFETETSEYETGANNSTTTLNVSTILDAWKIQGRVLPCK
jgi:hypothetical protein